MENKTATKTCPRCGRTLPVENFGRHSKTKDGYQPICQDCRKEAMKKGREKIRQARLKYGEEKAVGFSLKPNGYLEYTRGKNKSRSVHVVLMEEHIGRRLLPGEVVHHINGDKTDNRIENLMLMTKAEHTRLHARLKHLKQTK